MTVKPSYEELEQRIAELERTALLKRSVGEGPNPNAIAGSGSPVPPRLAENDRFHRVIEAAPLGVHLYRLSDEGKLVFTGHNAISTVILGVDLSTRIGCTIEEVFPALAGTEIPERYRQAALTGARWSTEQITYEDERIRGAFEVHAFQTAPGEMAAMFWEITARKQMESDLRESRERMALALEAAELGCWDWDTVSGRTHFSDRWFTMLGYAPGELPSSYETWTMLLHPEDREASIAAIRDAMAFGHGWRIEFRLRAKQGGYRRILGCGRVIARDASGAPLRAAGTHMDITEQREAVDALQERDAMVQGILRAAPVVVGMLQDRIFLWSSPRTEALLGYSPGELEGKNTRMLYADDAEYERVGEELYSQVEKSGFGEIETVWRRKDGHLIDIALTSTPLDPSARKRGIIFAAQDITHHREFEKEKEALERQLLHVQKLESLGVLAGGIAHDFNNMLMAILGNAELAAMRLSDMSPARDNLLAIQKASERAADLCRQLLAYAGKGRFEVQRINISELVEEMTHMLDVSISKKAMVRFNLAETLPAVEADPSQLRQIIMNLIVNASEAIGDRSGIISCVTGAIECDQHYLARTHIDEKLPPGVYIFLEVADTGCGMDKETLEKIFDPFFTTKFMGRGLGMSAVLGIVRSHKGAIKVYSEPGKGTTVKVLLPALSTMLFEGKEGRQLIQAEEWKGEGTLLLVDDDETVRAVGRQMLEHLGYNVLTAADGREALQIYEAQGNSITSVILDLTMPHLDGAQTFRILRQMNPDVRVILSSGYNEQEVTQHFLGKGLAGFIQKPYQLKTLRNKLQELC